MDFSDELASLIAPSPPASATPSTMSQGTSNERSTTSCNPGSPDEYRHNIFDISAPTSATHNTSSASASSMSSSYPINFHRPQQAGAQDGSPHSFSGSPHDGSFHSGIGGHHHSYLNSTLPALNSSMRYEPLPDTPHSAGSGPPPSSFTHHFNRHTPSPITVGHSSTSRSRSRSRPPSASSNVGGVGPQRNSRSRRNNSISSTSPPPHGHWNMPQGMGAMGINSGMNSMGMNLNNMNNMNGMNGFGNMGGLNNSRPQAIVIPRSNSQNGPVSPLGNTGWEYTLPTPDSLHGHSHLQSSLPPLPPLHHNHSHNHSSHNGNGSYGSMPSSYGNFGMGMSPTELPPVSSLGGLGTPSSLNSSVLSASPPSSSIPVSQEKPQEKQNLLASEKRRRRRESHNAVERRRRDNINEKISELATLIPVSMLEAAANSDKSNNNNQNGLLSIPLSLNTDGLSPSSPTLNAAGLQGLSMSPVDSTSGEGSLDLWKESSPSDGTKKEEGMTVLSDLNGSGSASGDNGVVKANKGMILRKSVEYIRYLQQLVSAQGQRNRDLEEELRGYREGTNGGVQVNGNMLHTHAGGPGARTPTPGDIGLTFSMGNYGMDKFGMFGLENLHERDDEGMDVEDDDDRDGSPEEERRGRQGKRQSKGIPSYEDEAEEPRQGKRSARVPTKSQKINGLNGHANGHHLNCDSDMESAEQREMKMEI